MDSVLVTIVLVLLALFIAPRLAARLERSAIGRGVLWTYATVLVGALAFAVLLLAAFGIHALLQF